LKTNNVIVVPYSYQWKIEFDKIKKSLENVLEDIIISIEHVGSTSVEDLGYYHEGDLGIKKQL